MSAGPPHVGILSKWAGVPANLPQPLSLATMAGLILTATNYACSATLYVQLQRTVLGEREARAAYPTARAEITRCRKLS
jgi:hypothetical protein